MGLVLLSIVIKIQNFLYLKDVCSLNDNTKYKYTCVLLKGDCNSTSYCVCSKHN